MHSGQTSIITVLLSTLVLSMLALPAAGEPVERELYVLVEFDAEQSWRSETEEFGKQFYDATTSQRYELRTRLRSDGNSYPMNLLDPDQETRLKAKTIHLARKALRAAEASGNPIQIPDNSQQRSALTRRMQEEQFACGGDAQCRRAVTDRYAAVFAAMEYPEALQRGNSGEPGRYVYYEPYTDCTDYSRVTMQMTMEGERWNKGEKEVVPFSETRSADTENPSDDVPVCQRYLAVIDKQDDAQPMYLENFYLPSAIGETVVTELEQTMRKTERQPMVTDVLNWITQQLKHAPVSGTREEVVKLIFPLNGRSEETGAWQGQADVKLTWRFEPVGNSSP